MIDNHIMLELNGNSLTAPIALRVLDSPNLSAGIAPHARDLMSIRRRGALSALRGRQVYGWNGGVGHLKDEQLSHDELRQFQIRMLMSTCAGVGPMIPEHVARLFLVLKANQLARGTAGVRPELAERILDLANVGITPCMPMIGSLGVGDLQPQAAAGLLAIGENVPARIRGREGLAPEILAEAGLPVKFVLEAGEALPIISGCTVIASLHMEATRRATALADMAEGALALFMEATRALSCALDHRTHAERNLTDGMEVARRLRALTAGSGWMTAAGRTRMGETDYRVQDALSVRGAPHAMTALRRTLADAIELFELEANASTSNPLVFERDDGTGYEFVSGGNWSSSVMSHASDTLNANLAELAVLSEQLSARLLCDKWSYGLPMSLAGGKPGLNSGMTHVQTVATALIPEIQVRAMPSAVLSRPAKYAQEDHNPMAMASIRNLLENLDRLEIVLAVQFILCAQGVGLITERMAELPLGAGSQRVYDVIRERIPVVTSDQCMSPLLQAVIELVQDGSLLRAVRAFHPQPILVD